MTAGHTKPQVGTPSPIQSIGHNARGTSVLSAWAMGGAGPLKEYALGELPYRLIDYAHPQARRIGAPRGKFYTYPTSTASAIGTPIMGMGFPLFDADGQVVNFLKMGPFGTLEDRLYTGLPVAGCYVVLGKPTPKVLVTVDPIDAMALHAVTGLYTIAVLYAENLPDGCKALKRRFPKIEIHVCVNGDKKERGDVEYNAALRIARGIGEAVVPAVSVSGDLSLSRIYCEQGRAGIQAVLAARSKAHPWEIDGELKRLRILPPPSSWPHPVNGGGLMNNLLAALHRYIDLPENDARLVALWIVHTYTVSASRFNPLLVIVSPDFGCGKSTLFALLRRLCFKAFWTTKISPAKVAQTVNKLNPTLLMDEAKPLLENASFVTDLIASYARESGSVVATHKRSLEVADVFGPKAVALKGEVPEALVERSLQISLQRMVQLGQVKPAVPLSDEKGVRLNDDLTALSAQLRRWADDHLKELSAPRPAHMSLGSPRVSDTFWPLLAIANAMGEDIAARAMQAARESVANNVVESPGVLLLTHLQVVMETSPGEFLATSDLLEALNAKEDWGWATYNRGKPLDALWLSKLLKPYNVTPCKRGGGADRGYRRSDLGDAIRRYVTSLGQRAAQ